MRRKNTKPTLTYWLVDARTNTPFYCGKTVEGPRVRLKGHRAKAKLWPLRATHRRILECGTNIRIEIMEIVPAGGDWAAREMRWIELLRFSYPDATNVSAGGVGTPGQIPSTATREKRAASMRVVWADETAARQRREASQLAWANGTAAERARRCESMRAGWAKRRDRLKAAENA